MVWQELLLLSHGMQNGWGIIDTVGHTGSEGGAVK